MRPDPGVQATKDANCDARLAVPLWFAGAGDEQLQYDQNIDPTGQREPQPHSAQRVWA